MKEFMESLTEQAASFLSPVSELNKLVLNNPSLYETCLYLVFYQ